ncbi:uncharacterized protein LOC132733276 [Ruditapes philippinarum]|uniref:uncharacterized protein LOC132733276 n=1 Tax=Ruditapes philippinarum TaxID=129788 RepID=UPI00295BAE3C|nr:uncharacterized protein LOC132733276 [Ruditapes philippinarum]XP_060575869.1 uncharacterized protein LOC132733276 [Ruditapes philippinarum]XP_060575870.1 uncharacterized protein LOC132733276 [Ruditapes philippinarum]
MSRPTGGKNNSLKQPKEEINIKYMHRPPLIAPNYGNQKRSLLPKSKVSRVLLYDNATQEHMLDIKLAHIKIEKERISRIINLHQRSFTMRMNKRQQQILALTAGSRTKTKSSTANGSKVENPRERSNVRPKSLPVHITKEASSEVLTNEDNESDNLGGIKLPAIDNDKRHVIFKVKAKSGKTEVYHTIDDDGFLSDLLPMHSFYPKLTDDPRFRSLQNILVPSELGNSNEYF